MDRYNGIDYLLNKLDSYKYYFVLNNEHTISNDNAFIKYLNTFIDDIDDVIYFECILTYNDYDENNVLNTPHNNLNLENSAHFKIFAVHRNLKVSILETEKYSRKINKIVLDRIYDVINYALISRINNTSIIDKKEMVLMYCGNEMLNLIYDDIKLINKYDTFDGYGNTIINRIYDYLDNASDLTDFESYVYLKLDDFIKGNN